MKKTSIIGICITAFVAIAAWAPNVLAYTNHSSCRSCHSITYDNARHAFHRGATADLGVSCDICHDNNQVASSCAVCHDPAPLQTNHIDNYGVSSCEGCHPQPECTVNADCDDGIFCNGAETCNAGTCMNGTPPTCDDGVACTVDSCDATSDACVNTPNDAFCDDGDVCTGSETCDATLDCQAGTPLDCDDQELCTTDSCNSVNGCANVPVECPVGEQCDSADGICKAEPECTVDADCNDGFFCNGLETCDTATGTCQPGTPVDCDDGVDCTVDTCDEVNDECVNTPDDFACPDDGLFCTGDEICDSVAGCISTGDPCPEGMTCNEDTNTCDPSGESVQGLPWLMLLLE